MSISKNFLYNVFYQLLMLVLPLLTTPYLSRVIGAEGIGIYSYAYAIVNYFILFGMLGLNNYGNRVIAAACKDKIELSKNFFSIYGLQLFTTISMLIIYLFYVFIFDIQNKEIFFIQTLFLFSSILDINWFFFGLEKFKLTVTRNTIIKLLTVVCIFTFVKDANDLWIYSFIMSVGVLLSQLCLWMYVSRYVVFIIPSAKEVIKHLKPNLILFIPVLSISIYKIMDKIMLGALTNVYEVAYYENSEKIINIPLGIITALGVVMLPRMTNILSLGRNKMAMKYIEYSLQFSMFMSIGICIGLIGVAPNFISFFLGKEFMECITITSLLSISVLFISWANVIRTQYLIPKQKDKIYIYSTILGALVNLVTNIVFIPKYGAIGAAIGTIFAEFIVCVFQTIKVKAELQIKKYLKNTKIFIVPAMLMLISIKIIDLYFDNTILVLIFQIFVGFIIYSLMSIIFILSTDRELRISVMRKLQNLKSRMKREGSINV